MNIMLLFLSGGTGTPKLLQGFRELFQDKELAIIANTADDFIVYGLYVSPDVDTLIYLFSNQLDLARYWGVKGDSFTVLKNLKRYYSETWFSLGDKDIALHIFRTELLKKGYSLSKIVKEISKKLSVEARILPCTDNHIETRIVTETTDIHFQEYWVKHRANVRIKNVYISGLEQAIVPKEIISAIEQANKIIIGPSNPITSIGPILQQKAIYSALEKNSEKVVVVSPLIGNQAISGPAVQLMKAKNVKPNPIGIARYYSNIAKTIIVHKTDANLKEKIEKETQMKMIAENIIFNTVEDSKKLAEIIMKNGD